MEGNVRIRRYKKQPKTHQIDEELEAELEQQRRISKLQRRGLLR